MNDMAEPQKPTYEQLEAAVAQLQQEVHELKVSLVTAQISLMQISLPMAVEELRRLQREHKK